MLLWKLAQWPQVIEAYSTMVTGAFVSPTCSSGSGPGFISSSTDTSVCLAPLREELLAVVAVSAGDEDRYQAETAARATAPAPANSMLRRVITCGSDSICDTRFRSKFEDCFKGFGPCVLRQQTTLRWRAPPAQLPDNIGSATNKANRRE